MKHNSDLRIFLSTGLLALLSPLAGLSPNRATAGGLDINLNFEVAPPPASETVVVEHGAPAQEFVVQGEPPPPQSEVIIERPSAQHVWVAGYWHWQGNHYVWVRGHWILPPRSDVEWIPPHVEHRAVFVPGHWHHLPPPPPPVVSGELALPGLGIDVVVQNPQPAVAIVQAPPPPRPVTVIEIAPPRYETVIVENEAPSAEFVVVSEPPPPREEVIIERPSARHVWITGYWHWQDNRYGWVRGHWALPPREDVVWTPPHVEHRNGGKVFIEGSWRHGNGPHGGPAAHSNPPALQHPAPPPATHTDVIVRPPPPAPAPADHAAHSIAAHPDAVVHAPPPAVGAHVLVIHEAPPALRHEEANGLRPSPHHIWVPGYWKHDGRAYIWESGHWEKPPHEGAVWVAHRWELRDGGWVLIEGHWDHR